MQKNRSFGIELSLLKEVEKLVAKRNKNPLKAGIFTVNAAANEALSMWARAEKGKKTPASVA